MLQILVVKNKKMWALISSLILASSLWNSWVNTYNWEDLSHWKEELKTAISFFSKSVKNSLSQLDKDYNLYVDSVLCKSSDPRELEFYYKSSWIAWIAWKVNDILYVIPYSNNVFNLDVLKQYKIPSWTTLDNLDESYFIQEPWEYWKPWKPWKPIESSLTKNVNYYKEFTHIIKYFFNDKLDSVTTEISNPDNSSSESYYVSSSNKNKCYIKLK